RHVACDEAQPIDDLGAVRAEAQHLAKTLVEGAVRAVAGGRVLDDEKRHRRTDDAGHRSDGAVVVTRLERDRAGIDETRRGFDRWRPTLEEHGADDRTAHRSA